MSLCFSGEDLIYLILIIMQIQNKYPKQLVYVFILCIATKICLFLRIILCVQERYTFDLLYRKYNETQALLFFA